MASQKQSSGRAATARSRKFCEINPYHEALINVSADVTSLVRTARLAEDLAPADAAPELAARRLALEEVAAVVQHQQRRAVQAAGVAR